MIIVSREKLLDGFERAQVSAAATAKDLRWVVAASRCSTSSSTRGLDLHPRPHWSGQRAGTRDLPATRDGLRVASDVIAALRAIPDRRARERREATSLRTARNETVCSGDCTRGRGAIRQLGEPDG